jgi:hypothetical protein
MPDANYSASFGNYKNTSSGSNNPIVTARSFASPAGSTTALRINTAQASSFIDSEYVDAVIHR